MKARYCYWSVCDGAYSTMMKRCVGSARACGVFKEFHVLTDRGIPDCDCYEAYECDKSHGLFKLHYLKVGMSRLIFDYFVWIDADTLFLRNPIDVLGLLSRSPIHVPLGRNLMEGSEEASWNGISDARLCQLFRDHGVQNRAYAASSAFWILHHDAIEPVYDLALQFWHSAKEAGTVLDVSAVLAYAMQMLCADPEAHLAEDRTDIWGSDDDGALLKDLQLDNGLPPSRFVLSALRAPAILHIPKSNVLTRSGTSLKASQGVGTG